MRVLVIEDDQETASFLRRALKESGHVAEYAADGQTGLDLARANAFDVLIVDRMLPKCDGLAVIGTLRAEEIRTPALILSALGEVDDRVKGLRAGGSRLWPGAPRRRRAAPASWWATSCSIASPTR
jgi:two-component system OmpR family response regulator